MDQMEQTKKMRPTKESRTLPNVAINISLAATIALERTKNRRKKRATLQVLG